MRACVARDGLFVLVVEFKLIYSLPVRCVDVTEAAKIDSNAIACIYRVRVGFLGQIGLVGFESEGDKPLASGLF